MLIFSAMPPRGSGRRKPTDKRLFVFASFLAPQLHLKRKRSRVEPGAQAALSNAASRGRGPLRDRVALCGRGGCGGSRRQEDESASGASGTGQALPPSRPAAPCPRAPARVSLPLLGCGPARTQAFPRVPAGPLDGRASPLRGLLPSSLPRF